MDTILTPFIKLAKAYFGSRIARVAVNVLATGVVILTVNQFLSDDVQVIADIAILAFGLFATLQTDAISTDLRAYVTGELLKESKTTLWIKEVAVPPFREIVSGYRYEIGFVVEYERPPHSKRPLELVPRISMIPAMYVAEELDESAGDGTSVWSGEPILLSENQGVVTGVVRFDTNRINAQCAEAREPNPVVALTIQLADSPEMRETSLTVGSLRVRLRHPQDLFRALIRRDLVKKIPAGLLELIGISTAESPIDKFYTNICFLSRRLEASDERRAFEDDFRELEFDIARFLAEECNKIVEAEPKRFRLEEYKPHNEYENDLCSGQLLNSIMQRVNQAVYPQYLRPEETSGGSKILVSLYQTEEFTELIEQQPYRFVGVCLFGFGGVARREARIELIFDLRKMSLLDSPNNACYLDRNSLANLSYLSLQQFQEYAPTLYAHLAQSASDVPDTTGQDIDDSQTSGEQPDNAMDRLDCADGSLAELLGDLRSCVNRSLRVGQFVTSEPQISRYWFELDVFQYELVHARRSEVLRTVVDRIISRSIDCGYRLDPSRVIVANLCTSGTDISSELPALHGFQHSLVKTADVTFRHGRPIVPGQMYESPQDLVVVLTAFDSYVEPLRDLVRELHRYRKTVVTIISVFSIVQNPVFFEFGDKEPYQIDVLPIFSIDRQSEKALHILERKDLSVLRPWLVSDGPGRAGTINTG
jgi:hypothetical protein